MYWHHVDAPPECRPGNRGFERTITTAGDDGGPGQERAELGNAASLTPDEQETLEPLQAEWNEQFGSGGEGRRGYVGAVSPLPGLNCPTRGWRTRGWPARRRRTYASTFPCHACHASYGFKGCLPCTLRPLGRDLMPRCPSRCPSDLWLLTRVFAADHPGKDALLQLVLHPGVLAAPREIGVLQWIVT